jgi:hypothetical protein
MPKITHLPQNFNNHRSRRRWGMSDLSHKLNEMAERSRAAPGFVELSPEQQTQTLQELERFFAERYRMRDGKTRAAPVYFPAPAAIDCRATIRRDRGFLGQAGPPPQKESPQRQPGADSNVRYPSKDNNPTRENSQRIFGEARCCARAGAFFRRWINHLNFCRIFEPRARAPP